MARTALNVNGSMTAGVLTSKILAGSELSGSPGKPQTAVPD
jgi:L-cystine uptake protein TcyP (sodium:dicarboxylate symporter family)